MDEGNAAEIENGLIAHKDLGIIPIVHHPRKSLQLKLTGVYKIVKQ